MLNIVDAANINKQGFDATKEAIFSENLMYIEDNLDIVLEYPVLQTGYETSIQIVWLDEHIFPLDLECELINEMLG